MTCDKLLHYVTWLRSCYKLLDYVNWFRSCDKLKSYKLKQNHYIWDKFGLDLFLKRQKYQRVHKEIQFNASKIISLNKVLLF